MTDPSWASRPHNPFDASAPPYPAPQHSSPPPTGGAGEVNTLATLSVIFAFVFAPAGAILGHLGLSQIARTHQRGRDRALVGLTLSYVVITAAVVALVVWAALGHNNTGAQVAAPPSSTLAAPSTTAVATTTTPPPPPPVGPAEVEGLMPTLDEFRGMTGDQRLSIHQDKRQLVNDPGMPTLDRPDCLAAVSSGSPDVYNVAAVSGSFLRELRDVADFDHPLQVAVGVTAFHDAAAARAQLDNLVAAWRRCSNSTVHATYPDRRTSTEDLADTTDAGGGITSLSFTIRPDSFRVVHLIAAKNNIVIDGFILSDLIQNEQPAGLAITNFILDKIPGPR